MFISKILRIVFEHSLKSLYQQWGQQVSILCTNPQKWADGWMASDFGGQYFWWIFRDSFSVPTRIGSKWHLHGGGAEIMNAGCRLQPWSSPESKRSPLILWIIHWAQRWLGLHYNSIANLLLFGAVISRNYKLKPIHEKSLKSRIQSN